MYDSLSRIMSNDLFASMTSFEAIKDIVQILVIPFCVYIVKEIATISQKLDKVETVLIGVDGKNGLRSRHRRLEIKVDEIMFTQKHPNRKFHDDGSDNDDSENS